MEIDICKEFQEICINTKSIEQISRESGVAAQSIRNWQRGIVPMLDKAQTFLETLGYEFIIDYKDETQHDRAVLKKFAEQLKERIHGYEEISNETDSFLCDDIDDLIEEVTQRNKIL